MGCGIAAAEDHGGITAKNRHIRYGGKRCARPRRTYTNNKCYIKISACTAWGKEHANIGAERKGAARKKGAAEMRVGKRIFAQKPFDK